ncbi:ChaN family lipoprotein [Haliangium sp.]|uniref:ChaN family lipoprotein n=1 Tax=Haliangium sp. TaxID=2663208 RepID=UPI003D14FDE6
MPAGRSVRSRRVGAGALALALAGLVAAGCGGRQAGAGTATTPTTTTDAPHGAHARGDGAGAVEAAALPFEVLRAKHGGAELSEDALVDELAAGAAVCIGEMHRNPHHHWAQLHLLDRLSERAAADGVTLALGMEMFQRPFQAVLDDYAAGRIDEDDMLARTGWETRWGYDFGLYRPMVRLAVERGVPVIALNLSDELRKRVSDKGVEGLSEGDRAKLPQLELADAGHRAWWDDQMAGIDGHGHGHGHGDSDDDDGAMRAERTYTIQVLWDETMADTAARWLSEGEAGKRRMVILAGSGHCHDSAIVRRLERRGVTPVVSVRPLLQAGDAGEDVSAELVEPIVDYLFIMSP